MPWRNLAGWQIPPQRWGYSDSVSGRSLGLTPATQRYKIPPGRIKTHEVTVFCGGGVYIKPGGILHNGGSLHNPLRYSNSVCWMFLDSSPARQRYKVRPYAIKAHEVVVFCAGSTLGEFYSMADSSTRVSAFPTPFAGGCWA